MKDKDNGAEVCVLFRKSESGGLAKL